MIKTGTLPSGLRVIYKNVDSPVAYCGYAIAAGTRNETQEEQGLAHFCEHMTFKGTEKLSSLQVINSLERVGGELNAFTTKEDTFFYAAVLKEHFSRAVGLLTEIVFHSTYPQDEIEKEVEVVCDEIESYNDTPSDLIYDEFENEIFRNTSLGHSILGTAERVRRFTTADCLRFTQRLYRPENSVFYVVGNVDFPRLMKKLAALLPEASQKDQQKVAEREEEPLGMVGGTTVKCEFSTHQAHVMLGTTFRLQQITDPQTGGTYSEHAGEWALLNNMLGGPSMNSRLNLSLREKRGLVYSVDSSLVTYRDRHLWTVYFGSDPKDVKRCLRLIRQEIDKLQAKPLSPTALKAAKQQLKGQIALASENRENFAIDMAKQYLHRSTVKDNDKVFAHIDAVTPEQLQQTAQKYLSPDLLTTMIMN